MLRSYDLHAGRKVYVALQDQKRYLSSEAYRACPQATPVLSRCNLAEVDVGLWVFELNISDALFEMRRTIARSED